MNPIELLVLAVADSKFGEQIDSSDENLFLTRSLDPTDELDAELIGRFRRPDMNDPDEIVIHVYGRKAGFKQPKENPFKFCSILSAEGFQGIRVSPEQVVVLYSGKVTAVFELEKWAPSVPAGLTCLKLDGGKATLKKKDFRSILIWLFWKESPFK